MTKGEQLYAAVNAAREKDPKAKISAVAKNLGVQAQLYYAEKSRLAKLGRLKTAAGDTTIPRTVKRTHKGARRVEQKKAAAQRAAVAVTGAMIPPRGGDIRVMIVSGRSDQLREFVRSVI